MKTSQITKKQQIRNAIIYMLPLGLSSLLPLITIPIFTRILMPEEYGLLALAMIYAIFMCGLVNFGMSLAFERNYFQYKDNSEKLAQLLFTSLVFVSVNFAILSVLTYLFRVNISEFLTGSTQHGILIFTAFAAQFFCVTVNNFYLIYFKNKENAKTYTKYRIMNTIFNFIISLFLVVYMRVGVIGFVMAQLATGIILFLLLLYVFLKELPFSLNKSILLESLKISYPLTPRIITGVLNTQFDKYMISIMATISGVGVYHIGKNISDLIFTFMTAIENVFNPQIYQRMFGQHEQSSESIGKYLTPFLYISIFLALCLALFSKELLTILTPKSYHGAIPIITILSMYFGILFFGKITGTQLIYSKKTHITSLLSFLSLGLNVGLNIPLIMRFGAVGAAWGTMLAGLISGTISLFVAQHYYKVYYEWNKIIWIMGTFFIGATFIASINLLGASYLLSLSIKMTVMSVFLALGVRYGFISKENFREIKSIFLLRNVATT